jgi:copper homeostasis protein
VLCRIHTSRALDNGADRLEICGYLGLGGGVSPSFALVHRIRKARPDASLMVMVRPRPGDFVYEQSEIDLMIEEIQLLKSIEPPIQGVVLGCLTSEGSIDLSSLIR